MKETTARKLTTIARANMNPHLKDLTGECVISLHHSLPLETPVDLVIETERVKHNDRFYTIPSPNRKAKLVINHEDELEVEYSDYIDMFMPIGDDNEVKSSSKNSLSDMFDTTDSEGVFSILSKAGAFEVSDFEIQNDENTVIYIRDNKIIQIGPENTEELESNGWVCIDETELKYCYSPMSKYIIWGEIESDDIKIIIY